MSEQFVRFNARRDWIDEARVDGYRELPVGSDERKWYIDESQKILFEQNESSKVSYE